MKIETQCLHAGYTPGNGDPRVVPIVQSTTYTFDSTAHIAALILFIPYLFLSMYLKTSTFEQYSPYSSVIEKDRCEKRELFYRRYSRAGLNDEEY